MRKMTNPQGLLTGTSLVTALSVTGITALPVTARAEGQGNEVTQADDQWTPEEMLDDATTEGLYGPMPVDETPDVTIFVAAGVAALAAGGIVAYVTRRKPLNRGDATDGGNDEVPVDKGLAPEDMPKGEPGDGKPKEEER